VARASGPCHFRFGGGRSAPPQRNDETRCRHRGEGGRQPDRDTVSSPSCPGCDPAKACGRIQEKAECTESSAQESDRDGRVLSARLQGEPERRSWVSPSPVQGSVSRDGAAPKNGSPGAAAGPIATIPYSGPRRNSVAMEWRHNEASTSDREGCCWCRQAAEISPGRQARGVLWNEDDEPRRGGTTLVSFVLAEQ